MQSNDIEKRSAIIEALILQHHLKSSLDLLRHWVIQDQIIPVIDSINDLEFNYRLLIQYVEEGVEDPQRGTIYFSMIRQALQLLDSLKEESLIFAGSGFQYQQIRYYRLHPELQKDYFSELESLSSGYLLISLLEKGNSNDVSSLDKARKHEQVRLAAFEQILVSQADSNEQLSKMISSEFISSIDKAFFISALTFYLLRHFNEERMLVLMDAAMNDCELIRQRALVGIWAVGAKYSNRLPYYPLIGQRLDMLLDHPDFRQSMKTILIQFIRSADTERISKKIQEEILPEMMKMAPHLQDKLDMESWVSPEEWEDKNPDWQEMIEKSGVADKLMEMSELQIQGADVYMNTFAQLKQYPFFGQAMNWLLPFDENYSEIASLFESKSAMIQLLVNNSFLCNSDKYSLAFSLKSMPESQRNMMMQAIKMENEQLMEAAKTEQQIPKEKKREQISNQYIQDLYRFFKLNPYRHDFYPLFDHALKLHKTWLYEHLQFTSEQQMSVADFYFNHEHYEEAMELYGQLIDLSDDKGMIYQKMGFCAQQQRHFQEALDYFLKAEALLSNQKWLTRKIAFCFKMIGNVDEALTYYRFADSLEKGEDLSISMQIGHLLVQKQNYSDALNAYFKVELSKPDPKVWRAIAWSSFLSGKTEQAEKYALKILETSPTKHDWLNAGHIAWVMKNRKEAITRYLQSIRLFRQEHADFFLSFDQDIPYLEKAGIDRMEISFLLEQLRYKSDQ